MTDNWTPIPPQSTNGWGQYVQGMIFRLHDKIEWHETIMREMRREKVQDMRDIRREISELKNGKTSSGLIAVMSDWATSNWWKIAVALFPFGAAYGKTGELPNPVTLLKSVLVSSLGPT